MEPGILPDRPCGSCNVCCVALTIHDPELQKAQGYRCRNAQPDSSCAIYPSRPQTCRSFNCGWRQLKWIREPLRPDRSGVLVRLHGSRSSDGTERMGVIFMLLSRAALKADGLAETIAASVAADVPTYLNVPGPPGYTSAIARINDVMAEAVITRDKPGLLRTLRQLVATARAGKFEPIDVNGPGRD